MQDLARIFLAMSPECHKLAGRQEPHKANFCLDFGLRGLHGPFLRPSVGNLAFCGSQQNHLPLLALRCPPAQPRGWRPAEGMQGRTQ